MSRRLLIGICLMVLLCGAVGFLELRHLRAVRNRPFTLTGATLEDFASIEPLDAHVHVFQTSPELIGMLHRLHLHVLDILYVDDTTPYLKTTEPERTDARSFVKASGGNAQLCTTFDPFNFFAAKSPGQSIAQLNQDFAAGAVAAKVWKNIGMEIQDASGKYVMPDDPRLDPIYKDIAAQNKTLIIHAAEPDEAWGLHPPGAVMKYYETNPKWDMAKNPNAPAKEAILRARDHVLEMNPDLRVVGAHFGSMEDHLGQVAARLDRYPNFAVDTAARVRRLIFEPRDKVRAFFVKYQDRIVYGTDLHLYAGTSDPAAIQAWEKQYALDWRYFSTGDTFEYQGHTAKGLRLPRAVLKKLYHDNAVRWLPGIVSTTH